MRNGRRGVRITRDYPPLVTVAGASLFFVLALRALWNQHVRFGDHVFDLGIFDQGLWLLSRSREPFVSLRGLHLFADHSSYLMVLLTPLYWIWADARMLLVVVVACLAVGAPLVHAIARSHELPPWAATGLAAAYLLNPVVLWQAWEDFHPEIVAVPCILGAYLLSRSDRPWWALAPLLLLLTAKEDAAFVVIPLALLFATKPRTRRLGFVAAAIGVAVLALNFLVLLPHFSPTGDLIYTNRYETFGSSFGEIVGTAATDPGAVFEALANEASLLYLSWTIAPLFLAVLAPEILAVGIPITLLNLLSSFPYQHEARRHYTVYFITIVALAAVVGAARLARRVGHRAVPALAIAAMVLAALVSQPLIGPNRAQGVGWSGGVPPSAAADVEAALAIIPSDAVLAADTFVAARSAHRSTVYRLPMPWTRLDWGAEGLPPIPAVTTVEWVAVLTRSVASDDAIAWIIDQIRDDPNYDLRFESDLVIIFQRR